MIFPSRDASARSRKGKKADVISEPVLLEQYVALSDFRKCGKGQINLVAGDVVEVIEKSDNGMFPFIEKSSLLSVIFLRIIVVFSYVDAVMRLQEKYMFRCNSSF